MLFWTCQSMTKFASIESNVFACLEWELALCLDFPIWNVSSYCNQCITIWKSKINHPYVPSACIWQHLQILLFSLSCFQSLCFDSEDLLISWGLMVAAIDDIPMNWNGNWLYWIGYIEEMCSPQDEPFAWRSSEFGFSRSWVRWQHSGGKAFKKILSFKLYGAQISS